MKRSFSLICFLIYLSAVAQVPINSPFVKRYGGRPGATANDVIRHTIFTSDGNLIGAGSAVNPAGSFSGTANGTDQVWIIKVSRSGAIIWSKCFGGPGSDLGFSITETPDHGFVVASNSTLGGGDVPTITNPQGGASLWVFKIDASGNLLWSKIYQSPGEITPKKILSVGNDLFVAGYSAVGGGDLGTPRGGFDGFLIKLSSLGDKVWAKCYGGPSFDQILDLTVVNNKFYAAGLASAQGPEVSAAIGAADSWLMKLDTTGNKQWDRVTGTVRDDYSLAICSKPGGKLILAGRTTMPNSPTNYDCTLTEFDTLGNFGWSKSYGGPAQDEFSVVTFQNGKIIAGGTTFSFGGDVVGNHGNTDVWVVVTDSIGNFLGQECVGGTYIEQPMSILPSTGESFYLAGSTQSSTFSEDTVNHPFVRSSFLTLRSPFSTLKTKAFFDLNNNGVQDAGEVSAANLFVQASKQGHFSSVETDKFGITNQNVDTGSYNVSTLNPMYFSSSPASTSRNIPTYFTRDSITFRLIPSGSITDFSSSLVLLDPVRPGFIVHAQLSVKNKGTNTQAATLVLRKPTSFGLLYSAIPPTQTAPDSLVWNISSLTPQTQQVYQLSFQVQPPPIVNNQDTIKMSSSVTGNFADQTPLDNHCKISRVVVGSMDPNDKTEFHSGRIPSSSTSAEKLVYLIRFQNTGTDTAFTVEIRDTLSPFVDWTGMEMVSSSHPYKLSVVDGKVLIWRFENINLVDSLHNESLSHGYIAFNIPFSSGIKAGDTVKNTAAIYFDYNLPVFTNTAKTTVYSNLITSLAASSASTQDLLLTILPNPSRGRFTISLSNPPKKDFTLQIVSSSGATILSQKLRGNSQSLIIPVDKPLSPGVYFISVLDTNPQLTRTLVIQ